MAAYGRVEMTDARNEMGRFGFCQDQEPHPIFERLAALRNTERSGRKVEREIDAIEARIEQSMIDAEIEYQARMHETPVLVGYDN